jgi:prolyl-tRNA synthetase
MFSDSDLIGIPLRITIGKQFLENYNFELKDRKNSKTYTISENNNTEKPTKEAINNVFNLINR